MEFDNTLGDQVQSYVEDYCAVCYYDSLPDEMDYTNPNRGYGACFCTNVVPVVTIDVPAYGGRDPNSLTMFGNERDDDGEPDETIYGPGVALDEIPF